MCNFYIYIYIDVYIYIYYFTFPIAPARMSSFAQVVMAALNAAQFRRDRVQNLAVATGTPLLATPQPGRGGSKRKTVPRKVGDTVGSTASTSASTEKVTPDPKHIRTGSEAPPEPKQLFASPVEPSETLAGGEPALVESEGGVSV